MISRSALCELGAVLLIAGAVAAIPSPLSAEDGGAKMERLLSASGYAYTRQTPTVWSIAFHGKALGDNKVVLAIDSELLVVFVTIAKANRFNAYEPEFEHKLLRFSDALDRVKVGFDQDGDLFVRTDASLRLVDVQELKIDVEQLESSSEEIYGTVASLTSGSPPRSTVK